MKTDTSTLLHHFTFNLYFLLSQNGIQVDKTNHKKIQLLELKFNLPLKYTIQDKTTEKNLFTKLYSLS